MNVLDEQLFCRTYLPVAVTAELLEANQRPLEHQLVACKFVHPGPPARPTLLGVLTIGRMPTDWAPGAYVQFLRIDGKALGDPVSNQKKVGGPLPELLDELEDLIKTNIQMAADLTSDKIRGADQGLHRPAVQSAEYSFRDSIGWGVWPDKALVALARARLGGRSHRYPRESFNSFRAWRRRRTRRTKISARPISAP